MLKSPDCFVLGLYEELFSRIHDEELSLRRPQDSNAQEYDSRTLQPSKKYGLSHVVSYFFR